MTTPRVEFHDDSESLATAVAGQLLARLVNLQAAGVQPQIVLTGGTIAGAVHRELRRLSPTADVDWSAVVVWFGDERFVPAASTDRNARGARADLLDAVGATQVHEIPASDQASDAETAAKSYSTILRTYGSGHFDVLMLSVGPDGHIASLFPGHAELEVDDQVAVAVHDSPKPPHDRVSLTFGALRRARSVWFLASGEVKADAVAAALAESGSISDCPARGVRGEQETLWFLDAAAAARL